MFGNNLNINDLILNGDSILNEKIKNLNEDFVKYGSCLIIMNFIILSHSFIGFLFLIVEFQQVQDSCKEFIMTFSLNIFSKIIYMVASALIGVAVKRKSYKYFKKYLFLISGFCMIKIIQFYYYVQNIKNINWKERCEEAYLLEEKEFNFIMNLLFFGVLLYITI